MAQPNRPSRIPIPVGGRIPLLRPGSAYGGSRTSPAPPVLRASRVPRNLPTPPASPSPADGPPADGPPADGPPAGGPLLMVPLLRELQQQVEELANLRFELQQANKRPNESAELQLQIEALHQRLEEAERDRAHTRQLAAQYEQRIQALNQQLAHEQERRAEAEQGGARTQELVTQYQLLVTQYQRLCQALNDRVAREQERREQAEQARDRLAGVQAEHDTVTQENIALRARVEELAEVQAEHETVTQENIALRAQVKEFENQQTEAQQLHDELINQHNETSLQLGIMREERDNLARTLSNYEEHISVLLWLIEERSQGRSRPGASVRLKWVRRRGERRLHVEYKGTDGLWRPIRSPGRRA